MGANASQKLNLSGFPKDLTIKLTAKAYDTEQSNCSFLKKNLQTGGNLSNQTTAWVLW